MEKMKEILIEPKGSYFETDTEGFLINPTTPEKIQEKWKPAIDSLIEAYKNQYSEKLKNVYIRGSVAKGEAIENVSDLDSFAYVEIEKEKINYDWVDTVEKDLKEKYPFVEGFEISLSPIGSEKQDSIILNQSLCVYGTPVEIPKQKPGKDLAIHAPAIQNRLTKSLRFLEKEDNPENIKNHCVWAMKGLLRIGFEITMERSKKYTRDLYRCYETFSEYYPEKESEMKKILYLALNPTENKEELREIFENFGKWLSGETEKYFELEK